MHAFLKWINELYEKQTGQQIIFDGKAIRAAADKVNNGNTPYIVSAYLSDLGISIGQQRVKDKSNEATAIPELIKLLDIDGCIITIDAAGTQTKIMNLIKKNNADFVLALKENQKGAYAEAVRYFDVALRKEDIATILSNPQYEYTHEYTSISGEKLEVYVHREKAHGRKTERLYIKTSNVGWIKDEKFKHVESVVKVITNTTVHDNSERYYIASTSLPAIELGKMIRKHWQIENNLHWVLDMYFYEDLSRTRKDNALDNVALLRKIVFNILRFDYRYDRVNKNGNTVKLSTKRKINRYNLYPSEFEELLFSVLPARYTRW
jgi:predicted transposase YbfD/YdcC